MAHGHIPGDHRPCTKGAHRLWQGKGPRYDASFGRERAGPCYDASFGREGRQQLCWDRSGWGSSWRGKEVRFPGLWELHQELFPCHWDVSTQDIISAAPDIPMAVPSSSLVAMLQKPPFNGGQRPLQGQQAPRNSPRVEG